MIGNFDASLAFVLKEEGGFSDDPRDPGGATNHGVTLTTFRSFFGQPNLSVADLKAISPQDVAKIYKEAYWATVRGDELPAGVDLMLFNMSVNAGPRRSVELLQEACGVNVDGALGPKTFAAAATVSLDDLASVTEDFYRSLRTFSVFGKGWLRRLNECYELATTMVKS